MTELAKPKKQFKSQSVNSLFRQQTSMETGSNEMKKSRSPTPTGTKVKLVSRKSRTVVLTSKKSSIQGKQAVPEESRLAVSTTAQSQEMSSELSADETKENRASISTGAIPIYEDPPSKVSDLASGDDDLWSDLHSSINTEASITRVRLEKVATYSPESNRTWTSPNSKLSSFRRSFGAPGFQSLSQSPLSKPADSQSRLFTDFNVTRHHPEQRSNTLADQRQWSSPNIWNTEDRSYSTKSDSAIPWSPFDIESLSLDDPFKIPVSSPFESQSRSGSRTSRFFPSPMVEQNPSFDHYPKQMSSGLDNSFKLSQVTPPIPQSHTIQTHSQMNFDTTAEAILPPGLESEEEVFALEFANSSQKTEQELFPDHFQTSTSVPISLYNSHEIYGSSTSNYFQQKWSTSFEQQSYPEGFASTFYKRGANNFMFIRELQPKLVTSKHKDTVEVRVSFPTPSKEDDDSDALIKMRCHIVNVDVRDLEGRIGGIKVAKNGGSRGRFSTRGPHRGIGRR